MTGRQTFSDEQLTAYLDGEAEPVLADDIRIALETDPELGKRLDGLVIDTSQVATTFKGLLANAPHPPDLSEVPSEAAEPRRVPEFLKYAAVAFIAVAIGWSSGSLTSRDAGPDWKDFVATYHALYVTDTLAPVSQDQADAEAELAAVANVVGHAVDLDVLNNLPPLTYKRAQVLGFEGTPLMQMTFLTDQGVPIALCLIRSSGSGKAIPDFAELQGMSAATWSKDGFDFLLIGGTDAPLIRKVTDVLVAQL
ncbi:MAG: hypothetical protein JJ866_18785 [Roseibium sp.]|uniref:hypothetical protein n=1 Tax=Roseibium sp. TaxID=1936156 RepID=UPI001B01F9BA|nr:hypothetical protein [Roseibium sp.]MBO6893994.1 hypothetical protein [Roseibium sp.]MBO6930757.1 hypothetical protein [Roseibium sp.]